MRRLRLCSVATMLLFVCLALGMGVALTSCREPDVQGELEISLSDSISKSILPATTKVTWIMVEGSLNNSSGTELAKQSFELGSTVDIKGLAAGTWTISVTGYNGKPDGGGTAVTGATVNSAVSIRSGKTTQAIFELHYLNQGYGTAQVTVEWPNSSVTKVSLSMKDAKGTVSGSASKEVGTPVSSAQLAFANVPVGNYDLDVVLTNASGSVMEFPMIDMVSVFNDLQSEGTITLVDADVPRAVAPVFSVTDDGADVSSRTVTITSSTPNTAIYYTTDGNSPAFVDGQADAHTQLYGQPFAITAPVTEINALVAKDGYQDSTVTCSGELTVSGSNEEGGVDITNPCQISNIVVTSMDEVYLEDPSFQIVYDIQGAPVLDSILWYLDGNQMNDTDNDNDYTYDGYLSAGRHQMTAKISYYDGNTKKSSLGTLRFSNNGQVAKPVVMASSSTSGMRVSIASATSEATIRYTDDGTEPTVESTVYEGTFTATVGTTVKAMATAEEYRDSDVVCTLVDNDGTLTVSMPSSISNVVVHDEGIQAAQPQFSVTYDKENVSDETIAWYMDENTEASTDKDGDADPTTFTYGGTLSVGRHQVRAKITYIDGTSRQFASGSFRFDIAQVATPSITAIQTDGGKRVTLTCDTEGAAIYYSIFGNDPDTANANELYKEPFTVALGTTVKVMAVKDGLANSAIGEATVQYVIGDTGPAGGIIFFIDENSTYEGWTYLEAAPFDDSTCLWGGYETLLGITGTSVGSGKTNTEAIAEALGTGMYAAKVCEDKTITSNGTTYDDWFLPSRDELDELYDCWSETGKGLFSATGYWSSSEDTAYVAWMQNFGNGMKNYGNSNGSKAITNKVRAVRAF